MSQVNEEQRLRGGAGGEDVFVVTAWHSLDWMLSCCCCCFEVGQNDRLIVLCLFAVAKVSWCTWVGGGERGEGEGFLSQY